MLRELNSGVQRSKSLNSRNRPVSVNMGARPTHVNDKEIRRAETGTRYLDTEKDLPALTHVVSDTPHSNILSDIDYLRAREEEEKGKSKHLKRLSGSSRHQKRASLPSAALSGTKNLLHGRFGEAFRKFEGHQDEANDYDGMMSSHRDDHNPLSPIEGSVATDLSDDRRGMDETEELPPELRRELEKQKLEAEERRVERAAAEYRQRMDVKGGGPPPVSTKAASIQNRVQSLLKDNDRPSQKTATGYGRFTADAPPNARNQTTTPLSGYPNVQHDLKAMSAPASATDLQAQSRISRPVAPPKPQTLRTGANDSAVQQANTIRDDWEDDFSKKYPALPQLDVTETGIDSRPKEHQLRMREI